MRLRQEQIVFLVAVVILGWMTWGLFGSEVRRRRRDGGGGNAELEHFVAPDVSAALPRGGALLSIERELFAPPRSTQPLPPLGLVEPPREPLVALLPPPEPGPAPASFGALLRRRLEPLEAPDLFAEVDAGRGDVEYELDSVFAPEEEGPPSILKGLGYVGEDEGAEAEPRLTPQEIAAQNEEWKRRYDWVFDRVRTAFGRIENEDRYRLAVDPDWGSEPLLFTEILPETGAERVPGAPPIRFERDRAADWGFAATFANEIEVRRLRIGDTLSRGRFGEALALAGECVRRRLEAPRALPIAEELYRLCADFDREDPAPRLGLARCFEAQFDLEAALEEYLSLLETFDHRAEVHARLGLLEARLLLFERAEERLRHGVEIDRGSWEARWSLGRFLAARGRHGEALEHLEQANKNAPTAPEMRDVRTALRVDLADAHYALGRQGEAHGLYAAALRADPLHQRAWAGYVTTRLLDDGSIGLNGGALDAAVVEGEGLGFDLLLARGLEALLGGDHHLAKERFEAAAEADPLRANQAWRALSFLAEHAGFPEEALRYVELALECDPTDAWALYQEGRLLALGGDFEAARASLLAALEQELDFEDALAALGEMAFRLGGFQDAERYLERAVAIQDRRPELHALRGLNMLLLGSVPDARGSFERGLEIQADDPVSRAGLAWCTYLSGDSEEALIQLAHIDDSRRGLPADDPYRRWAREQIERIRDHEEKVQWSDRFERKRILNDWDLRESVGPTHRIVDGELVQEGTLRTSGRTMIYRQYQSALFVSIEADLWVSPETRAKVGLFVARERERRQGTETIAEVHVARHPDGGLQVVFRRQGQDPRITDMGQPFPTGRWVRLRIERTGEASDARVTLFADGVPLVENVPLASLGRAQSPILVGLFSAGETGRPVHCKLDNVKVVYRQTN